ncbi:hypothetical protein HN014_04220 [Aquimarina sp. TRL1]|uniref:hypothetical protein n=1 Tax=Aquimarina sp. (strain TRL1) TaxID=2736252 RepID=UPI001589CBB2|nr:hypothetical protein [Aquimarina sp. TRL1]QKX04144.1 hypothetical protein HN014_04220 [Aquimarina sp. TRL1]
MSYNDELMRYQDDAEDRYDDYDGDMEMHDGYNDYDDEDDYDFDSGFEGNEDGYDDYDEEYEDEYVDDYGEDGYDDYTRTSIGRIDPNDRTLTVVVKNTSDVAAEAVVFGGNEEAAQPAGVTVTVEESSHKEVREESKANPFKISGMKYSVSNPLQFDNVLKLTKRTAAGSNTIRVYQPRNATSPQNFTQQLIDDDNFELNVTGQDSLRVTINPETTAVFTFTIKARANMGNLLKGNNVAELSRVPRTTGLPQIDLIRRRKRSTAFGIRPRRRRRIRRRPVGRWTRPRRVSRYPISSLRRRRPR